jgi:hypothetical protein
MDEGRDGAAGLQRVAVAAKWPKNLKSNVPGTNQDMLGVAHPEIDVANIRAI